MGKILFPENIFIERVTALKEKLDANQDHSESNIKELRFTLRELEKILPEVNFQKPANNFFGIGQSPDYSTYKNILAEIEKSINNLESQQQLSRKSQ
jgi:hypothetical protein